MPPKLKAALKALGYVVFFIAALLFFVYVTLPLDALESYMVRKASDEYGADLEITELSMWGLSGLEMEGVTLTPRPTPEEITEIREAREARAAWQARQQAKAAEAEADEPEEKAGEKADPAGAPAAGKPGADDGPTKGAPGPKTTTKAQMDKAAAEKAAEDDKPPPVPAGPQPLYVESLRARVALGKLIGDLMDGKLLNEDAEAVLEARLLGGSIEARVEKNSENTHLVANFAGLDLAQLTVLRALLPLPVVGAFDGEIDLEVPLDDDGKLRLASAGGHLSLSLSNAVLGPGRIESDDLRNFGGFFDVPRLTLAQFGGKINFERRRAVFEDFAFRGKDLEGDLTGYVQLANKLERFNPRAYLRFKFAEDFLEREKGIGVLMRTVPQIKRGTGGDGYTGFAVSMRNDPKTRKKRLAWRPTPRNPYGPRTSVRDAKPTRPSVRPGRGALRERNTRTPTRRSRTRLPTRKPTPVNRKTPDPVEAPEDAPEPEAEEEVGEEEDDDTEAEPSEDGAEKEEGEGEDEGEEEEEGEETE